MSIEQQSIQSKTSVTKQYFLSTAELIDRINISQMKEILNHEHRAEFTKELDLLLNDLDIDLKQLPEGTINAQFIRDIIILVISNSLIWTNEDAVRSGAKGHDDLYFTHQINDLRSQSKNKIQSKVNGRVDFKLNNMKAESKYIPSGY